MSDTFYPVKIVGRVEGEDGRLDQPMTLEFMGDMIISAPDAHVYKTQKGKLAFHRDSNGFVPEWILHVFDDLQQAVNFEKNGRRVFSTELIQDTARALGIDPPYPLRRLDI